MATFILFLISAIRGQKVSAAGVVSTYSLIYTVSTSLCWWSFKSNGEIYFIPAEANRGQKISTGVPVNPGYALSPFFNKF
jgi:hypothetical protein